MFIDSEKAAIALSIGIIAFSTKGWYSEMLSAWEMAMISAVLISMIIAIKIYLILVKLNTTIKNLKQTSAHAADKLTHIEMRLMNFTLTAHEAQRMINQAFFEWDVSVDPQFFVRKVTQWAELWSSSQHRAGMPCSLAEWQYILKSAVIEIGENIAELSDEVHKKEYFKNLTLFQTQRSNYETTQDPTMSQTELRDAYKASMRNIALLMPSLDK